MDLYLFFNCINNISEIIKTPEDKISLKHELMINDPLIFNFYTKNLSNIPKSLNGGFHIGGGGKLAAASKVAETVKAANTKEADKGAKGKEGPKGKEGKKGKEGSKEDDNKARTNDEAAEDQALEEEIDQVSADSESAGELDGLKKFLKSFARLIVGFLTILMIPIVPWVMITIYSFKKLGNFFEINTNRL